MAKRELTEQQKEFLSHLIGDARGDIKLALQMAGYSPNTKVSDIIKTLRDEMIALAKDTMALNSVKAAFELEDVMKNPTKGGASISISAAKEILNRANVVQSDNDLKINVSGGGLFILPAKEVRDDQDD